MGALSSPFSTPSQPETTVTLDVLTNRAMFCRMQASRIFAVPRAEMIILTQMFSFDNYTWNASYSAIDIINITFLMDEIEPK